MTYHPPTPVEFLSVQDLAARLGVSTDTIWRWKRKGRFPNAVKMSPGTTCWRLSDIIDYEKNFDTCFAGILFTPVTSSV